MRSLNAFTVTELIVVCILTAAIFAIGFSGFQLLQSEIGSHEKQTDDNMTYIEAFSVLESDWLRADEVTLLSNGAVSLANQKRFIHVGFCKEGLWRRGDTQQRADTIKTGEVAALATYRGAEATPGQRVDKLQCWYMLHEQVFVKTFRKHYGSQR